MCIRDSTYTMRKGTRRDTCYVKLKYDKLLDTKKVRLVVQIRDAEDFLAGRTDYRTIIIWFHNILSKPPWWTSSAVSYTHLILMLVRLISM